MDTTLSRGPSGRDEEGCWVGGPYRVGLLRELIQKGREEGAG
jgi:hypothetical protein